MRRKICTTENARRNHVPGTHHNIYFGIHNHHLSKGKFERSCVGAHLRFQYFRHDNHQEGTARLFVESSCRFYLRTQRDPTVDQRCGHVRVVRFSSFLKGSKGAFMQRSSFLILPLEREGKSGRKCGRIADIWRDKCSPLRSLNVVASKSCLHQSVVGQCDPHYGL